MMDAVAEQRQDDEHGPNLPAVPDTAGSELEPQRPALPADPEELRRFREFQQFQEFQRFQEYQRAQSGGELEPTGSGDVVPTPPAEPPAKRKLPAWLTTALGKVVSALLVLIAVVLGAAWAINYFLGGPDKLTPDEQAKQGGKKAEATKLYASSPYEAVRRIYDDIAQGDTKDICLRFDEAALQQFVADMGYTSCAQAAADLHEQVTDVDRYAESLPSSVSNPDLGDVIEIDSCEVAVSGGVRGGPALGTFTVTKLPRARGDQWLITGHGAGPKTCPAPAS